MPDQDAIGPQRLRAIAPLPRPADRSPPAAVGEDVPRPRRMPATVFDRGVQPKALGGLGSLLGGSAAMQTVYDHIHRVARTDETVFITGPTGTGKEVTATTIHALSHRNGAPFVAVNCGGVAAGLIESEFFGHERGAFTGADKRRIGVFEQAQGGTLFLDEITEMPVDLQVKLLRALETRQVRRVGGSKIVDFDVRILVATNREPKEAVASGKLREDLMYRLFVFPIDLPPLKDREGDVRLLAQEFLERANLEHGGSKRFADEALQQLEAHSWPGNVRELANVVRRANIMAPGDEVDATHLPPSIAVAPTPSAGAGSLPAVGTPCLGVALGMSIAAVEKLLIEATMVSLGGNKQRAAAMLGISLMTLYTRLLVYGVSARTAS